ncbi:Universal stress protein family protein [Tenacibaculum sp. MAR_2009_124]|uniref:universal stress protein n=1 Tax=Tenacibaculum sp. MAR_2009_124 TaxID=1250059 RepID=UPI00089A8096|nr:universal stress protein [Tenacibaculum sp. MAR_2009_124]SEC28476.1 Universal stress protein family protein [Tenacibaculum sp. MAR_2009_124]
MKSDKTNYRISVLTDLKESAETVIETALSIAKVTKGSIAIFHVLKPSNIVHSENQLSASRNINNEYTKTEKKIEALVEKYSIKHDTPISYSFSIGNIKNNIELYLNDHAPDIVVIGKKSSAALSFFGNGVTDLVLKKHQGEVVIAADGNKLVPNELINLGFLNKLRPFKNPDIFIQIAQNAIDPIKTFQFTDDINHDQTVIESFKNKKIVEYVFEKSNNVVNNLTTYLRKNNINLLCLPRKKNNQTTKELDINDVLNKLNISLLVTAN